MRTADPQRPRSSGLTHRLDHHRDIERLDARRIVPEDVESAAIGSSLSLIPLGTAMSPGRRRNRRLDERRAVRGGDGGERLGVVDVAFAVGVWPAGERVLERDFGCGGGSGDVSSGVPAGELSNSVFVVFSGAEHTERGGRGRIADEMVPTVEFRPALFKEVIDQHGDGRGWRESATSRSRAARRQDGGTRHTTQMSRLPSPHGSAR